MIRNQPTRFVRLKYALPGFLHKLLLKHLQYFKISYGVLLKLQSRGFPNISPFCHIFLRDFTWRFYCNLQVLLSIFFFEIPSRFLFSCFLDFRGLFQELILVFAPKVSSGVSFSVFFQNLSEGFFLFRVTHKIFAEDPSKTSAVLYPGIFPGGLPENNHGISSGVPQRLLLQICPAFPPEFLPEINLRFFFHDYSMMSTDHI